MCVSARSILLIGETSTATWYIIPPYMTLVVSSLGAAFSIAFLTKSLALQGGGQKLHILGDRPSLLSISSCTKSSCFKHYKYIAVVVYVSPLNNAAEKAIIALDNQRRFI
jgi:hypothetical protein